MKSSLYLKMLLFIVGSITFLIGIGLLFFPIKFEGSSGINLNTKDIGLLSEIRASGGTLLVFGTIIILGAFRATFTGNSLLLAIALYFAYGFSRLYAIFIDGIPGSAILNAAIAEVVIGTLCTVFYLKYKVKN